MSTAVAKARRVRNTSKKSGLARNLRNQQHLLINRELSWLQCARALQCFRDRLKGFTADNVNARELKPDGSYVRIKASDTEKRRDAQMEFAAEPS